MVIVHVAQGSYSGTISWFKYGPSNVSAHYVVARDGRVAQCVRNEDIAWHAGKWRYNRKSIGIEHAGYAGNPNTWTTRMYRSSAKLSAYLSRRFNIPVDRRHFIGHRQMPGVNRTCPGRYFDWDRYLRLVRHYERKLR
jgi:N-acetyl-anhydromuramyl-L-alanine amidase AmpD